MPKNMKKKEKLAKPAPKGVGEEKYDSCVDQVKQEGDAKSAYAICAASLKKGELDWSDIGQCNDSLVKHHNNGQWSVEPLEKRNVATGRAMANQSAPGVNTASVAKDDKPHPPSSGEDSAHDVIEEKRQSVYEEIQGLSDEEAREMLQHLRNIKKKGKEKWKRSDKNKKVGDE